MFSSIPEHSISTLGLISTNFTSFGCRSPTSMAMGAISDSLANQTAVAILDDNGVLVGKISPFTLACCDEYVAAAIITLSAGDLLAFTGCGDPTEEIVKVMKARLKEMNLEEMLEEYSNSSIVSSTTTTSSSFSLDDELSSRNTLLPMPGRYSRSCSYSARAMRRAEAIACHLRSSLAAVMVQAIAHRVSYIWVIDEDRSLVGIVTFPNMLGVLYEHLRSMA